MLLKGKISIVTGCKGAIGRAIVQKFVENGAFVFACAREETEELNTFFGQLLKVHGKKIYPVYFDLCDDGEMKRAIRVIRNECRNIDILVNNAGALSENRLFTMTPIQDIKKLFDINFFSQLVFTQYIIRLMIKHDSGSIINVSSVTAMEGDPAQLEYVSSKAAILGATRKLAHEFGPKNIRVNAIAPGLINTAMGKKMDPLLAEKMIDRTFLGRKGEADEVANVVLFLASELSAYISGQILRVDGGM